MESWILDCACLADEMSKNEKDEVEESIGSLSSLCRGKLGVCTRRMNEVKAWLAEGCDVEVQRFLFYVT